MRHKVWNIQDNLILSTAVNLYGYNWQIVANQVNSLFKRIYGPEFAGITAEKLRDKHIAYELNTKQMVPGMVTARPRKVNRVMYFGNIDVYVDWLKEEFQFRGTNQCIKSYEDYLIKKSWVDRMEARNFRWDKTFVYRGVEGFFRHKWPRLGKRPNFCKCRIASLSYDENSTFIPLEFWRVPVTTKEFAAKYKRPKFKVPLTSTEVGDKITIKSKSISIWDKD